MRVFLLLALAMQLLIGSAHAQVPSRQIAVGQPHGVDILPDALLFVDAGGAWPSSAAALPAWTATLKKAARVEPTGGAYWMVASIRNPLPETRWVIHLTNTVVDRADILVLGTDGSAQHVVSGYRAPHDYLLHSANDVTLAPDRDYMVVMRFSNQSFMRAPGVSVIRQAEFRRLVAHDTALILGSLGALAALAIVNLFIFSFTRNRANFYYAIYLVTYFMAWAMPFNVLADLFDWHEARMHYVPFFLLPVFSTLFYLHFLRLKKIAPRLASVSRINLVLPLLLVPTCFFAPGLAHKLATLVCTFWMVLALVSGIVAWKRGFKPARYFVFAFVALMAPGLLVVPANLGLLDTWHINLPIVTLVGGTLDALLLAFALADQIRLMSSRMEQNVARRTQELVSANDALTIAKERAEVISRHRIDFLSAMSHDIRTPLAGVIGMLKLGLRDEAVRGRTAEYLRIGLRNGESLLVILNDILDFSKIDAGKLTLELTSFPLASLVADAVGILQGQADLKGLALRVELDAGLPQCVEGDPTRIRQILVNLLGNAIKFTERGEVLLAVAVGTPAGGAIPVTFAVTDTGPGIPAEVQARLFQKFEQADHSTTRRYGGTGLGLAICKELVGLMGGAISVASRPGEGSRFTFTLPMAPAGTPPQAPPDQARERHGYRLRILCAEDVSTNQIIIGALLEAMGHQVRMVENGLDALAALRDADFDMVLMDGRMPLMDGEQATHAIRAGGTVRNARIPIIALTANASSADCARCLAAGMDGFLSKPVDEAKLYDVIQATIDRLLADGRLLPRAGAGAPVHIMPQPGLSDAHMTRIAKAFLVEGPRRLAQARAAIGAGDAAAATDALHALKGSAGYLSSPRLRDLAGALEALANGGLLAQAGQGLGELELAMAEALADLQPAVEAGATL